MAFFIQQLAGSEEKGVPGARPGLTCHPTTCILRRSLSPDMFSRGVRAVCWEAAERAVVLSPSCRERRRRAGGPVSCLGPGIGLGAGGGGLRSSQTDVSIQRVGKERRQERGTIFSTRRRDSLASARCMTAPCVRCTAAWRSAEGAPGCFPPCQLPLREGACAAQTGVHTPDCSAADLAEGSGRLRGPLRAPVGSGRTLVGPRSLAPVRCDVSLGPGCVLFG